MPLSKQSREDITDFIQDEVIAAFKTPDELLAAVVDFMNDRNREEVLAFATPELQRAIAAQLEAQASWPATTDCDRVVAAFNDLNNAGIIARHHWQIESDVGATMLLEEIEALTDQGQPPRGYTFYHEQDTRIAFHGHGLNLDYGCADPDGSEADSVAIGHEIVKHLRAHNLKVDWSGEIDDRIAIDMPWQHRWTHPSPR